MAVKWNSGAKNTAHIAIIFDHVFFLDFHFKVCLPQPQNIGMVLYTSYYKKVAICSYADEC